MTVSPVPPVLPNPHDRERVQCPNCCRMAPVTHRAMGLIFYTCELCFTSGSVPDDEPPAEDGAAIIRA